jgi:hypothetical protein
VMYRVADQLGMNDAELDELRTMSQTLIHD